MARLRLATAYLAIPTRLPAEEQVRTPAEEVINRAHQIFSEKAGRGEFLVGYEGNAFAFTSNVEEDLLSITSVHPLREDTVSEFLARAGVGWTVVRELIEQGCLVETEYARRKFYMRKIHRLEEICLPRNLQR